jgi:hypothetical protein
LISESSTKPHTRPPNPIAQGLRTILGDPVIFLVEILWRWSFAILACMLVFSAGAMLLGPLHVGRAWDSAWQGRDPQKIGQLALAVLLLLGSKLLTAAIVVPLAIALLWSILSAMGRLATVRRLRAGLSSLPFSGILALQLLRGFVTWLSVVLLIAAMFGEARIATSGPKPDLLLYYLMMTPSLLLIGVFWLAFNWYLSLAAFFGREGQSFRGAFRQARQAVALQRSDFAGTGFVFLLFRLVLLLVVVAICGLSSGMVASSPQTYMVLLMVVLLGYLAVSYFLYLSRMAAYLALAAAHVLPGGPKLVATSSTLPAEHSSPL